MIPILPSRKTEDWRWADLSGLAALAAQAPANDALPDISRFWIETPGPRLVFADGHYIAALSDPRDVAIAAAPGVPGHPLGDLAAARATAGVRLSLGKSHNTKGPVQIVHISLGGAAHLASEIVLDADAQASFIETWVDGGRAAWSNATLRIVLATGARLMRTVRVLRSAGAHTDFTRVEVGAAASYTATAFVAGCDTARLETQVRLDGVGAYAQSDGVLLARGDQNLDAFNRFDHAAPGGTSRQVWRVVADERATASFAGRVAVARGAQQTDAEQSVKALLLARTATVNAKPELEIFADDVKCAHGATVGELSRDALFYLASRGVDPAAARALLTRAFVADGLAGIGEDAVREAVIADADAWLEARP